MADTQTAKMLLIKPEVGASPDTWGNKWNGNADKIDLITVRNTDQWKVTPGDDTPGSAAGPWILSRYNNALAKVDEPISVDRQTGEITLLKMKALVTNFVNGLLFQYMAAPAVPAAGNAQIFFDVQGNACIQRPDGSIQYLGVPPGAINFTGAATADVGWAFLNGQAISRAANPVVFARYGVLFGAGDTVTTFNLPDAKGCVFAHLDGGAGRLTNALRGFGGAGATNPILGARSGNEANILDANGMPIHNHAAGVITDTRTWNVPLGHSGQAAATGNTGSGTDYLSGGPTAVNLVGGTITAAASGNTGGGLAHANVQPTLVMNAQVKLG